MRPAWIITTSPRLDFLGWQGMLDPPRPEAQRAVAACSSAGITVKMIHPATTWTRAWRSPARSAFPARWMRLWGGGKDLAAMDPGGPGRLRDRTDCVCRVAPTQKLELVRALQAHGAVGGHDRRRRHDARPCRQADIGIAMGPAVAPRMPGQAADMLLTMTISPRFEAAVEEGRGVYLNSAQDLAFCAAVQTAVASDHDAAGGRCSAWSCRVTACSARAQHVQLAGPCPYHGL